MKASPSRLALLRSLRLLPAPFLIACAGLIGASDVLGQGQADTPTGLAGGFGGSITTGGGSFDPYERNASRSITDVVVPGAVVPFTYTRIWNSRRGWSDNWSWGIDEIIATDSNDSGDNLFRGYKVGYPDGRVVKFSKPNFDTPRGGPGTYSPGTLLQDRFVIQPDGTEQLFLSDGSVVNFSGEGATSIVDPHGLAITFTYTTEGRTITEPGGRTIVLHPGSWSGNTYTSVLTTSAGQTVTYTNSYYTEGSWLYPGSGDPDLTCGKPIGTP